MTSFLKAMHDMQQALNERGNKHAVFLTVHQDMADTIKAEIDPRHTKPKSNTVRSSTCLVSGIFLMGEDEMPATNNGGFKDMAIKESVK